MALVYWLADTTPHAIPLANALFGSATAALVGRIGMSIFDLRTGLIAGLVYALWPGPIYYCATYFSETAFNFVLVCLLAVTMLIGPATSRRLLLCAAAGGLVGAQRG
jgi:uncharacterized membrane protein